MKLLLGAPDGHAKNFSVFIERAGRIAQEKLKMAVSGGNRRYQWDRILLRHGRETAAACGMGNEVDAIMTELLEAVPQALQNATSDLPADFPESVAGPIVDGVRNAAGRTGCEPDPRLVRREKLREWRRLRRRAGLVCARRAYETLVMCK